MSKLKIHIAIAFSLLFASSCDNYQMPVTSTFPTKLVKSEEMWSKDFLTNSEEILIRQREFDLQGRVIADIKFDNTGNKRSSSNIEYSESRGSEIIVTYDNDGKQYSTELIEYTFVDGQIVDKVIRKSDTETTTTIKFFYDEIGRLVRTLECSGDGKCDKERIFEYKFDNSGKLSERIELDKSGNVISKSNYQYSTRDGVSHIDLIRQEPILENTFTINYTYNRYGHIMSELHITNSGELIRRINYVRTFYN